MYQFLPEQSNRIYRATHVWLSVVDPAIECRRARPRMRGAVISGILRSIIWLLRGWFFSALGFLAPKCVQDFVSVKMQNFKGKTQHTPPPHKLNGRMTSTHCGVKCPISAHPGSISDNAQCWVLIYGIEMTKNSCRVILEFTGLK